MARRLGISSQLYGQYENDDKKPKADFFIKWKEVFNETLLKEFETTVSNDKQEYVYREQSLQNLSDSNRVLAEANKTLAEANKTLAEANHVISKNQDELIQLTKMIVTNSAVLPRIQPVVLGPEMNAEGPHFSKVAPSGSAAKPGKPKDKH